MGARRCITTSTVQVSRRSTMTKVARRRYAVAAGFTLLVVFLLPTRELTSITGQGARRWAEISSAASWRDTNVRLLIAGSGTTPARVESSRAKIVLVELPVEPRLTELVIVGNPLTDEAHVMSAGKVYVADGSGVTSVSLSLGALYLRDSHV